MVQTLEITTKIGCKNSCIYCAQEKFISVYSRKTDITLMSMDTFKKCIDKVPGGVNINFSGMCEPWLNPECTAMLLYAHQKGHRVSVFTTLAGMRLSDVDLFEPVPFLDFFVHLPCEEGKENMPIDENYLALLTKVVKSRIVNLAFRLHGTAIPSKIESIIAFRSKDVIRPPLSTRSGNVKIEGIDGLNWHRKSYGCLRDLRHNVLLPNGDVILCCMDFGMEHVIGNLLISDYRSLFSGDEFLKVKKNLKNDYWNILCNRCDGFSYSSILSLRTLHYFLARLRDARSLRYLRRVLARHLGFFRK